jgi:radical SAM protein with 4Fe4S-binding SPASM domain
MSLERPYEKQIMRTAPDYIQFYPTLRCNQSCDFCFNRSLESQPDMSRVDFRRMLDTIAALPVRTLDIIGGEPTVHADILGIVRDAIQQGLGVNISSNGTNTAALVEILGAGEKITVGISINDREALKRLSGFIRKDAVIVKSVFSRTMDRELIDDILALKPKRFYLIYRDALDERDLHAAMPFHRFVSGVEQRYDPSSVGTVFCSGFLPDSVQYPELSRVRCPAGTTKLGVMPDGGVYPCNLFFGRKKFLLGNILTDCFDVIWRDPRLDFFRDFRQNNCPRTACPLHGRCHGGCPAHSFAHAGTLDGLDPRCA